MRGAGAEAPHERGEVWWQPALGPHQRRPARRQPETLGVAVRPVVLVGRLGHRDLLGSLATEADAKGRKEP
jgi:hypothetical protein